MSVALGLASPATERPPVFILDARLALAPGGLVFAIQLARFAPVWLTRSLWALVDGAYFYRTYRDASRGHRKRSPKDGILDSLSQWHAAWLNGALNGVFFWIGDARRESALPGKWDGDAVARYESLSTAFPEVEGEAANVNDLLAACSQEASALAAALIAYAPVILTRAVNNGRKKHEVPLICSELAKRRLVTLHGPDDAAAAPELFLPREVVPLVRFLGHLDTRIATVHLLAPWALALPPCPPNEDAVVETNAASRGQSPWADAHVFWQEVS